mmetsp:Transcript_107008/g.255446  ORF Transcript_107008/g.255446 Transcript_107008/m.255446 type:complete len:244 (+) Transcript_107008:1013-1744(+)
MAPILLAGQRAPAVPLAGVGDAQVRHPGGAKHAARDDVAGLRVVGLALGGGQELHPGLLQHLRGGAHGPHGAPARDAALRAGHLLGPGQAGRSDALVDGHGLVQLNQREVVVVGHVLLVERVHVDLLDPPLHRGLGLAQVLVSAPAARLHPQVPHRAVARHVRETVRGSEHPAGLHQGPATKLAVAHGLEAHLPPPNALVGVSAVDDPLSLLPCDGALQAALLPIHLGPPQGGFGCRRQQQRR